MLYYALSYTPKTKPGISTPKPTHDQWNTRPLPVWECWQPGSCPRAWAQAWVFFMKQVGPLGQSLKLSYQGTWTFWEIIHGRLSFTNPSSLKLQVSLKKKKCRFYNGCFSVSLLPPLPVFHSSCTSPFPLTTFDFITLWCLSFSTYVLSLPYERSLSTVPFIHISIYSPTHICYNFLHVNMCVVCMCIHICMSVGARVCMGVCACGCLPWWLSMHFTKARTLTESLLAILPRDPLSLSWVLGLQMASTVPAQLLHGF